MLPRLRTLFHHLNVANMSNAAANTNVACCTIPAVHSDYTPKGTYKSLGGFQKVYVTGPEKSDNAIIAVFDIFGYFPQTQQGADIIASSLKTTVYMPNFFEPKEPFPTSKHPPKSDQDKADLQAFFGPDGAAYPPANINKLVQFAQLLKSNGSKSVGAYGYCWGAKICILAGGSEDTPLNALGMVHPAMLSSDDATKLRVPMAMYITKDEPIDEFNKINDIISNKPFASKNDSANYKNMFHGFAAARADLANEENKREFEDVYTKLVNFFKNTLY
ncbi:hypothetical protein PILCRDRAFT_830347 [Piloderma croceum F 1598]|uniref:Dienelactone hydrolase domain-containing protein n=1 Tax=Piloderma croceum (strain F 1598) TaxID=765440 RepID=A0A0C3B2E0_PILCF|nr:hypothetical protein PILCRDRAFT_830347 [Piloderma croceum F 1598]